jgi:hypothetical protein
MKVNFGIAQCNERIYMYKTKTISEIVLKLAKKLGFKVKNIRFYRLKANDFGFPSTEKN